MTQPFHQCSRDVGHLDKLQDNLQSALKDVETWTCMNRLPLNASKSGDWEPAEGQSTH